MLKERPGLQTERLIRLLKGGDLKDDRLYISNGLVKLKFGIRKVYKELDDFYIPEINRVRKILEDKKLSRRFKEDYKNYLEELNQYRDSANSLIMHHVEYRWRKGRGKDYLTCPRWEMPLFECVSSYVWDVINSDPKAKADMDKVFEDIFGEAMVYTTTDSQGNIISTEKVIQKLTINELIKDYQGPFINQLKQQDTFDNKTTYRIKRVDVGVYDVITEDKEVLDRIYKKQA